MKSPVVVLALAVVASTSAPTQGPRGGSGSRPQKQYTIEQFLDTTSLSGASFSPDESRILFSSNKTGIWNAYTMPVAGGPWTQITRSTTDSTYAVSFFPQDDRILLTHDQGGNELNHLYVRTATGEERDVTPGDKLKAQFIDWSHDGTAFFVSTNERDPKFLDVYRYDAKTYERTLLFENKDGYFPSEISGDGAWLALSKVTTTNDSDVYLWSAATRQTTKLSEHKGMASYDAAGFDPSSQNLYILTNDGGEFTRLRRYNLANGASEDVQKVDWDITFLSFSHGGRYRAVGVNADGRTSVAVTDMTSRAAVNLPELPNGAVTSVSFSRSEKKAALYVNGDRSPNNLFVLDLATKKATKITESLSAQIDPQDLVDTQVVRFKARDGITVPNILWKPHQATAASKAPALVWVHGGPGGQTTAGYSALLQYLANHGYVVLGINNRGSSGYGKTFLAADDQKHGREPLWDCVDAKAYLESLPYVDRERIGIIGGSYGGYMVLAALAFQPKEFKVGVDLFGVANWIRTLESMPAWWEAQRKALYEEIGNPVSDRKMLEEVSPLLHADLIHTPLMVLQGANDPRVIKAESDEIVAAVKKNGVPVEYVVFQDEGHGFTKKKNQIEGYSAVLKFLDANLKGKAGGTK
jgi:dipeptidyl aminopeptidase/acylaminoacyl peptidase